MHCLTITCINTTDIALKTAKIKSIIEGLHAQCARSIFCQNILRHVT